MSEKYIIKIFIPEDLLPNLKGRNYEVMDGYLILYLSKNTSPNNCLDCLECYFLVDRYFALVFSMRDFSRVEAEVNAFLNKRFNQDWELYLTPINKDY